MVDTIRIDFAQFARPQGGDLVVFVGDDLAFHPGVGASEAAVAMLARAAAADASSAHMAEALQHGLRRLKRQLEAR